MEVALGLGVLRFEERHQTLAVRLQVEGRKRTHSLDSWIRTDGAEEPQLLLKSKEPLWPGAFTPDGRRLAYVARSTDIMTVPLDLSDPEHPTPGKPEAVLETEAVEVAPAFSPDGHWMAYTSDESGRPEILVRAFPGPGGKWRVSTEGGVTSAWSRNGRELVFQGTDGRILVAEYTAQGGSFNPGKPRVWPLANPRGPGVGAFASFDLHPYGKRLMTLL